LLLDAKRSSVCDWFPKRHLPAATDIFIFKAYVRDVSISNAKKARLLVGGLVVILFVPLPSSVPRPTMDVSTGRYPITGETPMIVAGSMSLMSRAFAED